MVVVVRAWVGGASTYKFVCATAQSAWMNSHKLERSHKANASNTEQAARANASVPMRGGGVVSVGRYSPPQSNAESLGSAWSRKKAKWKLSSRWSLNGAFWKTKRRTKTKNLSFFSKREGVGGGTQKIGRFGFGNKRQLVSRGGCPHHHASGAYELV